MRASTAVAILSLAAGVALSVALPLPAFNFERDSERPMLPSGQQRQILSRMPPPEYPKKRKRPPRPSWPLGNIPKKKKNSRALARPFQRTSLPRSARKARPSSTPRSSCILNIILICSRLGHSHTGHSHSHSHIWVTPTVTPTVTPIRVTPVPVPAPDHHTSWTASRFEPDKPAPGHVADGQPATPPARANLVLLEPAPEQHASPSTKPLVLAIAHVPRRSARASRAALICGITLDCGAKHGYLFRVPRVEWVILLGICVFIAAVAGLWLWTAAVDVVCVMFWLGLMVCGTVIGTKLSDHTWSSCLAHEVTKLMVIYLIPVPAKCKKNDKCNINEYPRTFLERDRGPRLALHIRHGDILMD